VKIKRLVIEGFGPYKDEQSVDFEAFDADGIFLITGKTGAGKSSILDAICYALYNAVPRYEGAQPKLRSDHCAPEDPTRVELVFSVGDAEYRVERTPEYEKPKQRGVGLTTTSATAFLYRRSGDEWEGIASKPGEVGKELDRIVGLTKDQFLQVILLAQNRFQQFLRAGNDERQGVLRSLFGTTRFLRLEESLLATRKQLETELESASVRLAQLASIVAGTLRLEVPQDVAAGWFSDRLAEIEHAVATAERAATDADAAFTLIDAEYKRRAIQVERQLRRDGAKAKLAELASQETAIVASRAGATAAARAATAWPYVEARRAASASAESAQAAELHARTAYCDSAATAELVAARIDELTRQIGALEEVLREELGLPGLELKLAEAERLQAESVLHYSEQATLTVELPAQIAAQEAELTAAKVGAARQAEAEAALARAKAVLEAAESATSLALSVATSEARLLAATRSNSEAAMALTELTERRLAGHAAELAGALVDGEPCSVCGSTTHPLPASSQSQPVGAADVERARADAAKRTREMDAARKANDELQLAFAEATVRTSGLGVADAQTAVDAAKLQQGEATAAHRRAEELEVDILALRQAMVASDQKLLELAERREKTQLDVGHATTLLASSGKRIAVHLGEFPSIAERDESLRGELLLAIALRDAISEFAARSAELGTAAAALELQLAEHGFADEGAVSEARMSRTELRALEESIRVHEQSTATAQATLAEPGIVDLPSETLTLDEAALAAARAARDTAIAERSSLTERRTEVRRATDVAILEFDQSAALQTQFNDVRELAAVVHGDEPNTMRMKLETYVLAAQLEEIVAAANARLKVMTGGRFTLEHDDSLQYRRVQSGLGLAILDEHTGRSRATHSLSGGETFLASLALALGLAEVVTNQAGGITLDTLFIDEGFGSLDADTLEIAMSTLDSLRAGGRTIGLISHVDSMKEQITARLHVEVNSRGDSRVVALVPTI
jgi:DNA repair protein SbcC/Rad50